MRAEPQRLVVKRLLPHFAQDPEGRTMFDREAKLHQAVQHENVVTVFGAGNNDDGEPYLAMEFVDGCDAYRLLRRLKQDRQELSVGLAVFICCEVLHALASVHGATDAKGTPLGIIHRDVTPSNLYVSRDGWVKLGDFGIARSATRSTLRSEQSAVLKGKFAYLAPEQVAGESFDHRADLFSLASVLAEMLLGKPLFPGGGQLAVLLAIRDCRIDALHEVKGRLPTGLFEVLERALARDPDKRFQTATDFYRALAPFEPPKAAARHELARCVGWVKRTPSSEAILAVRDSVKMPAPRVPPPAAKAAAQIDPNDPFDRPTGEYGQLPSFVQTIDGRTLGPWTFARLLEGLATGQVGHGDRIDFMGRGLRPVEEIAELVRFLPAATETTNKLKGPGAPDFLAAITTGVVLDSLLRVLEARETGVLFAERILSEQHDWSVQGPPTKSARKELYFIDGRLHHVASSAASELLGEYLVRRNQLSREELDFALAVLPRYGGRIGDTLISLGLVGPVELFRAIREQGRDRVAELFLWKEGTLSFYRGQTAPHVEFPLDLDLPTLMIAGVEALYPTDSVLELHRGRLGRGIEPGKTPRKGLADVGWPPLVTHVLAAASTPMPLRELLKECAKVGTTGADDVLRSVEVLVAAKLLDWA
jgi:serine/threonine-protein kinase